MATVRKCIVCRAVITVDTVQCPECKGLQGWAPCKFCYKKIPEHAKRCEHCEMPQGWWRWPKIPETILALLTALTAVVGTAIAPILSCFNYNSRTSITFVSADPNYLFVDVFNAGNSRAAVRKAWLRFGEVPIMDAQLKFGMAPKREARRVIPAAGEVHLSFEVTGLDAKPQAAPCHNNAVTLEMEIEESNGLRRRSDTLDVNEIEPFIVKHIPGFQPCTVTK